MIVSVIPTGNMSEQKLDIHICLKFSLFHGLSFIFAQSCIYFRLVTCNIQFGSKFEIK